MKKLLIAALVLVACDQPNTDKAIGDGILHSDEVKQINLWVDKAHSQINATLPSGTAVDVLDINEDYLYVRSQADPKKYGYCNKGFVQGVVYSR